ncbi:hypothetical protein [Flavobacterium sp.]|jgi:hypothetical protein|uniref:hypothetical protein n=1 Tax=Flavobacterium sp. TaxID=239 RepID=UPI0037C01B7E
MTSEKLAEFRAKGMLLDPKFDRLAVIGDKWKEDESNHKKINKFENDFIPVVNIDFSLIGKKSEYDYKGFIVIDTNEDLQLSNSIETNKRIQKLKIIKLFNENVVIPFKVSKGNKNANDDDGIINIVSEGIEVLTKKSINIELDETIAIKVSSRNLKQNAKIEFFASDDGGFFDSKGLQNIFCGSFKFIAGSSKVGLKLTQNIEQLPLVNSDYVSPPTYSEPKKSFEVANKYQDCGGMCFAVSMARVAKAYKDILRVSPIKVETSGQDYLYSGTVVTNIPDKFFGYGVGGALAARGYADLVDHNDIIKGFLNEGAMIQYWGNPNNVTWEKLKMAIKNQINKIEDNNWGGGHSVIFKSYSFDANGSIDGLNCYDYSGINRNFKIYENKIFKGANLRDTKK